MIQWLFYTWPKNHAGFTKKECPCIFKIGTGAWHRIENDTLIITRGEKRSRYCRVGDTLIINKATGEYFRDLEYLPIYE